MTHALEGQRYLELLAHVEQLAFKYGKDPKEIKVVSVSKNFANESIQEVYKRGCRLFGESRAQELETKVKALPEDIEWHFIGSLQTNKVAKIIPHVKLIHSIDSLHLAEKISQVSVKKDLTTAALLQVNTSNEQSKHGLTAQVWESLLPQLNDLPNLKILGLMTMAPLTDDKAVVRQCFRDLFNLRQKWQNFVNNPEQFVELSMGMTHDYEIAIQEGSTLLRIGTAIFGTRI